jgi:hypothetical protein
MSRWPKEAILSSFTCVYFEEKEMTCSSETAVDFQKTAQRYIPDRTVQFIDASWHLSGGTR